MPDETFSATIHCIARGRITRWKGRFPGSAKKLRISPDADGFIIATCRPSCQVKGYCGAPTTTRSQLDCTCPSLIAGCMVVLINRPPARAATSPAAVRHLVSHGNAHICEVRLAVAG